MNYNLSNSIDVASTRNGSVGSKSLILDAKSRISLDNLLYLEN